MRIIFTPLALHDMFISRLIIFIAILFLPFPTIGQLNIDSLKANLSESTADSNTVKTLNRLAWNLRSIDPTLAMGYALRSAKLATEINFDRGRGDAYNSIGVLHYRRGEYVEATKSHLLALSIREKIGDREGMALSYINLGNVYSDQLNNQAAIDNYLLAAKLLTETGGQSRLSFVYLNIGAVFLAEDKFEEAIPYCEKAKTVAINNKDTVVESEAWNNMGVAYEGMQRFDDALIAYKKSFTLSTAIGDQTEMTDNMTNIGNMYRQKKEFSTALEWHFRSENLSRKIAYLEGLRVLYQDISKDYEAMGDFKMALLYHKHYKILSDSLFNEENSTAINSLNDKWKSDRNAKDLLVKQKELSESKFSDREGEQRLWVITTGGIILLLFSGYAYFASSRLKRSQLIIEAQQEEILRMKNR